MVMISRSTAKHSNGGETPFNKPLVNENSKPRFRPVLDNKFGCLLFLSFAFTLIIGSACSIHC